LDDSVINNFFSPNSIWGATIAVNQPTGNKNGNLKIVIYSRKTGPGAAKLPADDPIAVVT